MKQLFSKDSWHLPAFLKNSKIRLITFLLLAISLVCVVMAFLVNLILGLIILVAVILTVVMSSFTLKAITEDTNEYISDLSYRIKRGEQEALIKMPIGILFLSKHNDVEWINPYLQKYFGNKEILGKPLAEIDAELAELVEKNQDSKKPVEVSWGKYKLQLLIQKNIHAVYLMDITHYATIQQHDLDTNVVIGQIFLDNYDEITQSMNDKAVSNLSNYVTNELSNWAKKYQMYLKRIDDDHFLVLTYSKVLKKLEDDKFKILDRIRERTSKQNLPLTLSMGISYGNDDLALLAKAVQSNLDLALGRGGDQVVVKTQDGEARFYGGKTNPMEKRTRVRARMISQALQELMNQTDQVFVMGHKQPDMDSVGACLGIRRIAAMNQKKCWVVLNQENLHSDVSRLMDELGQYPDIKGTVLTPEEAQEKATEQSLLIMVDHSKPSISVSKELYQQLSNRVMVIDHHRRGEEFPENPILVYIEPYASSTCELITEMFEYQSRESEPINKIEATAMLTGIIIDTKSFTLRTGTRTFDAASYLRSVGADSVLVQHFMKENVNDFLQRNHLIDRVEFIGDRIALCVGEKDKVYDPVIAAQAADSLLNVSGVNASFVITERTDGKIGISARSNGEANVQVVMEQLGGGGHLSNAATQLTGVTIEEARAQLMDVLKQKHDE
ncbi:DHH family phosphoesterase [Liquorilactobacillus oeni]|uniref:Cyclic-di-AMP phosphodiesterase n=1 Tax=Liquorilactobacillus oeni DSM 19972 TaxID=1423777 RepID=A0A0R1MKE2_9LACO|nr:DHH family phosphoesterase [Liquorilactobacillus oeni]KRL05861.1 phosphoesterase, DHH family protein [Liquorilactobacillus oeni DSM 19972]